MASFFVSPSIVRLCSTAVPIQFSGTGTSWSSSQPTFTVSGVSGASLDSIAWPSDASATANLTTGSDPGTLVITDPSTNATFNVRLTAVKPYPGRLY